MQRAGPDVMVSLEEVERRVLRAIRTLAVQRDQEALWLKVRAMWPPELEERSRALILALRQARSAKLRGLRAADYDDLYFGAPLEADKPRRQRFEPTKADVGDYLTALAWFAALAKIDQEIVTKRAFEWEFTDIARGLNYHADTVRNRYRNAIRQCWRLANAGELARLRAAGDRLFAKRTSARAASQTRGRAPRMVRGSRSQGAGPAAASDAGR